MQLTGELAPLGLAHRETEFIIAPAGTPVAGQRIFSACGPTALGSAATAALQRLITTEQAYAAAVAHGFCDASGASTDGGLANAGTQLLGLTISEHHPYGGDVWNGWQTFLGWHLGSRDHPTVIELAQGQALHDEISGLGENADGLRYHFICLIKRHDGGPSAYAGGRTLPSGYWACDGDNYAGGNDRANNFNAADVLQFYSDTTLTAAQPCAAVAFNRVTVAPAPAPTGGNAMWTRDATGAHDEASHSVGQGVADAIFAQGWQTSEGLTSEHYYSASASITALDNGHTIGWDGVIKIDLAADAVAALVGQVTDANTQIAAAKEAEQSAQAAASAAQAAEAQAQAQVASLQQELAAAQSAPKDNPAADVALAALVNFRAALNALPVAAPVASPVSA